MTNRRAFLHAAALAALAPMLPLPLRAEAAPELWPRYRDVLAIDGEGGLDLLRADDTDAKTIERTAAFEKDNREVIKGMKEDGIFDRNRPDDLYTFIPDLNMANRFEVLATMLSARKHSDARIAKILGGNFERVLGEVWA